MPNVMRAPRLGRGVALLTFVVILASAALTVFLILNSVE